MSDVVAGNAVIGQSGGPTAVINQTLCGAIMSARRHDPSLRILGARYGVRGLTAGNVIDLTTMGEVQLRRLGNTPNSALGSTRDKPDAKACQDILAALGKLDARAFIYIGGNDTAGTLELLRQQSTGSRSFVHAPKTIDNDLMENDHAPGFISAAAFVSDAFVSMDLDFRAMPGIYVAIVMGRHAGFLTAAAAGWQQSPDDAPHLIYTPEKAFSVAQFLNDVDMVYTRLGRCIISMSEGVQDETGRPLAEVLAAGAVERDAHGNVQLTGGDLGIEIQKALKSRFPKARVRVDTLGYLPRGYIGVIDETDRKEALPPASSRRRAPSPVLARWCCIMLVIESSRASWRSTRSQAERGTCRTASLTAPTPSPRTVAAIFAAFCHDARMCSCPSCEGLRERRLPA